MEITKELKGRHLALVGFTLFSMFFGAGNLIFPPFMAAQAGGNTWLAMAGFAISAVGLPILGVIAVAKSGGLTALANRVHPIFAVIFAVLVYLSIGPCLAIPRTASTSFEMAVTPFMGGNEKLWLFQLLYSIAFFAVALLVALRPEKLTDRLGKILCPSLLVLIVVIFVACVANPLGRYGLPTGAYALNPVSKGFLDGYQTMDTIAGLNFGIVIAINIRAKGVEESKSVVRGTIRAGWIAGAVMLVVYAMLAHIGAVSAGAFPGAANGAETLTRAVSALFGPWGNVILAAIFVIACLNTCIGLISSCGEYFHSLVPAFSYRAWAVFFAVVSMGIANAGLNLILKVSVPVLNIIYPVAIVLIALALTHKWIAPWKRIYPVAIAFTGFVSVVEALGDLGVAIPVVTKFVSSIPLSGIGLGWIIPALVGAVLGMLCSHREK